MDSGIGALESQSCRASFRPRRARACVLSALRALSTLEVSLVLDDRRAPQAPEADNQPSTRLVLVRTLVLLLEPSVVAESRSTIRPSGGRRGKTPAVTPFLRAGSGRGRH